MSLSEWAKREVELACQRENPDRKEGEFDYGCACYESALKAYLSLCEDGHSGLSFSLTRGILERLCYGLPLTPIEDTDDIWKQSYKSITGEMVYQCKRQSSLFKRVDQNGNASFDDIDRFYVHKEGETCSHRFGFILGILNEMFPITMPYCAHKPYEVIFDEFLFDKNNGDFDTIGILHIFKDGEKIIIDRFFKEDENTGEFVEITKQEYLERKENAYDMVDGC